MILGDLFSAATDFNTDKLAAIMHPEIRFTELPNLINPAGGERGFDEALAGLRKGRQLLTSQTYDVHEVLESGDTIAARATWRGTLAATGQQLTAHIATFTRVRDGRIVRHATYDCYEPLA